MELYRIKDVVSLLVVWLINIIPIERYLREKKQAFSSVWCSPIPIPELYLDEWEAKASSDEAIELSREHKSSNYPSAVHLLETTYTLPC